MKNWQWLLLVIFLVGVILMLTVVLAALAR